MAEKNETLTWPVLIQMLFRDTTIVNHAHGTTNVQCPWHY